MIINGIASYVYNDKPVTPQTRVVLFTFQCDDGPHGESIVKAAERRSRPAGATLEQLSFAHMDERIILAEAAGQLFIPAAADGEAGIEYLAAMLEGSVKPKCEKPKTENPPATVA